jgi:hypothetical protein
MSERLVLFAYTGQVSPAPCFFLIWSEFELKSAGRPPGKSRLENLAWKIRSERPALLSKRMAGKLGMSFDGSFEGRYSN